MTTLGVELFTDPACPFAFSAEPVRWQLRWLYGDQLTWRVRMVVLTLEDGEADKLAEGAPTLQRLHGMPIDPAPYPRTASSEPACRAVVAVREHAGGEAAERLLRRLRVRVMAGGLIDEPSLIAAAASDAGIEGLDARLADDATERALRDDIAAARTPSAVARALDHKLGGPREQRRYTTPSYELRRDDDGRTASVPGFNPLEAYETAIANLAPELDRRARPQSAEEVLRWAGEPLATVEVAALLRRDLPPVRAELARVAKAIPAGADAYWEL